MNSPIVPPPGWIKKILSLFLDSRILEACLGDLEEKFQLKLHNGAPRWKASLLYALEGLGFLRMSSGLKHTSGQTAINTISHTFLFFGRLIRKDKSYYLVSLLGLTLSLSSFLLIMMFVRDELAFDAFHANRERIYRVTTHLKMSDVAYDMATSAFPTAEAMRTTLPEIEKTVRLFPQNLKLKVGENNFDEHALFADEDFFHMFSFPLIAGDEETALLQPASVVLTQSVARKYFGAENPLGKTILLDEHTLTVTGVIHDVPEQSHLKFNLVLPLSFQLNVWKSQTGIEGRENKWYWIGAYTYVLVRDVSAMARLQAKLPLIVERYFPDRYKANGKLTLIPLKDIHLKSTLSLEPEPGGSILYVRLFFVVGLVIILVSAINLINLSWFKISGRIREVGIRKSLGQNAARIVTQLSIESCLVGGLAFVLATLVCLLFIDNFNLLVQKQLSLWDGPNIMIASATLLMILVVCTLAVLRPASHYATRSSLHLLMQKHASPGTGRMRNILVGLQVCFSFVLLVFSLIIGSQVDFFRNKDLGFDKENVQVVELNPDIYQHLEAFKTELRKSTHVVDVTGGAVPGSEYNGWRFVPEGGSYEKPYLLPLAWCDYNFLSTLKISLVAGNNFNANETYDSLWPFVINQAAAVELGWADDALNKTMEIFAPGTTEIMARGRVIGVMHDYHYESLRNAVKPVVLTVSTEYGTALIRTSEGSANAAITDIGQVWKKFSDKPFASEPLGQRLERLYTNEIKLSNIMLFFTAIALVLTCYGMFAMSSLLFSSKLKEVSIRKIFGASQFSIVGQFYSRYALFNLIAIAAGIPIAIQLGNLWLETFQYRIALSSSLFIIGAVCILLAGLLSVSYYLIRISVSNPVKFLRRE